MESAQDRADYPRYLLRLCELERIDRERRNVERRIWLAHFPQTKSFDTFDFAAQPSLKPGFFSCFRADLYFGDGVSFALRFRVLALPLSRSPAPCSTGSPIMSTSWR
jgi:hypothetical protein